MSDENDPEEGPTEGVRIIGAQEAAEAAGRSDVVRRRRGGQKKYGDRPDEPAASADLPKITISTTEDDPASNPERYGATAGSSDDFDGSEDGPIWTEPTVERYGPTDENGDRIEVGHARMIPAEPEPDRAGTARAGTEPASQSGFPGAGDEPYGDPRYMTDPDEFDQTATEQPYSDEDSFVLPHWTEPPTGQVPKVVIGEDAPEPEPLATHSNQPRWRDEGEREVATDFDDLVDDAPRLGALSGDSGASVADEFFSDTRTADTQTGDTRTGGADGVEGSDAMEDFSPEGDFSELDSPRSGAGRRRQAAAGSASGDASADPSDSDQAVSVAAGSDRNLGTAIGVGVGLVILGLVCFKLGALPTAILATAIITFAAFEYFTAVRSSGHNPATLLGLVAVAGLVFATFTSGLSAFPIVMGLSVMAGLLWYLWVAPGEHSVANLGLTLLGVLWVGFLGSFATLFLGLGKQMEDVSPALTSNPGIGVLLAAVIVAVSHDVGAYFVGKYMGSTPLSAASPNKTQEGMIGGVLSALVVTVVIIGFGGISPIGDSIPRTIVFAVLCALAAPLGDLCESFVKRDLKVKDMGSVLPGHGGVLDRFDALLFVLPTAYFVTVLFNVWTLSAS
jgi:phosphatidate cytidylyltransferase